KLFVSIAVVAVVAAIIVVFLYTKLGLQIRATGDNADMVRSSSINVDMTKTVGLAVANALVALSGALLAQMQKFADISMGIGMVVIGLASLIIGEVVIGKRNIIINAVAVITGSIIYRLIIAFVLEMGIEQQDLKVISALIVTIAISYPAIKNYASLSARKKRGRNNAKA
ncbi:MAG: ABC transporter permease, partial [Oscillospiraceae bacterium]